MKTLVVALVAATLSTGPSGAPELPVTASFETFGQVHHSSPVLADLNGDDVDDLLVGDLKGRLYARTAWGTDLTGWPAEVRIGDRGVTAVESTPAVVDLDGDESQEVVVGAGSRWVPKQDGGLLVLNRDGTVRCRYRTLDLFDVWDESVGATPDGYSEGVMSTPAIGDIDGDGKDDIVFGAWDNHVHAINRACKTIPGFPFHVDDSVWSSPALHDVDGDGDAEIFVGSAASPGGPENWTGGVFRSLDWSDFGGGYVVVRWRQRIGEVIDSSPAIGDVDGDGRAEAIVGTGVFYGREADVPDAHRVFAWHVDDGSPVTGWPVQASSEVWGSPALGDLDGDGTDDVVFGARDGLVRAYAGDGTLLWRSRPNTRWEGAGEIISSPVIADLDGDGANDVALGNGWGTFFLRGSDGTRLYEPAGKGYAFQNSPTVGRFGDEWVVVVGGMNADGSGLVTALSIPEPGSTAPWPAWRRDSHHTGARVASTRAAGRPPATTTGACGPDTNPPAVPDPGAGRGYWSTARNGRVVASNARHFGSTVGHPLNAPIVGLAATPTGRGYWQLGADGGVFAFGDARFYGSTGALPLRRPVIDVVSSASGKGYWLVGADGGVFTYGDAPYFGSTGGIRLERPIVSLAPSPTGHGYFLFADDGGVFTYGDAVFLGSAVGHTRTRIVDAAANPDGLGYWLLAEDGTVFSFGEARYLGGVPGKSLCRPAGAASIQATSTGLGYWVLATDGRVFAFGDAVHHGDAVALGDRPVAIAIRSV